MKWFKKYNFIVFKHLFFIFNTVGLPAPLTFTNFAALIWIKSIYNKKVLKVLFPFVALSILYLLIHFSIGVDKTYYIKTYLYIQLLLLSSFICFFYFRKNIEGFSKAFESIAISSFILFIVAFIFFFTPFKNLFWTTHNFAVGGDFLPRYKGLGYEPSFYALTLSPIFIYFFLKIIFYLKKRDIILFALISVPIALTLSFGFFGALLFAIVVSILIIAFSYRQIKKRALYFIIIISIFFTSALSFDNFFSERIDLMIKGKDTSINGRTHDAFYLADQMARDKNVFFGIGLGQIKLVGEKHIREYYRYEKDSWPVVAIPNSTAETLAIFGYVGLFIRLLIQILIFIQFRVYRNYFNLSLFSFMFVYQLMGSYLTSTTEAIIWIIAILPIFKEFDITPSDKFKLS